MSSTAFRKSFSAASSSVQPLACVGPVAVGDAEIGRQRNRAIEILVGVLGAIHLKIGVAPVVIGGRIFGIERHGLGEIRDGVIQPLEPPLGDAAIAIKAGLAGGGKICVLQRVVIGGDREIESPSKKGGASFLGFNEGFVDRGLCGRRKTHQRAK